MRVENEGQGRNERRRKGGKAKERSSTQKGGMEGKMEGGREKKYSGKMMMKIEEKTWYIFYRFETCEVSSRTFCDKLRLRGKKEDEI